MERLHRLAALLFLATIAASTPAHDPRELRDLWLAGERLFSPFAAPDETRRLLGRVIASIRSLDLARLYEALPDDRRADRARLVIFHAAKDGEARRVSHEPLRSPLESGKLFEPTASPEALGTLGPAAGDGWFAGGVLPLDTERFRVRVSTALRIGSTDLSHAGAIAADFMRRLEARTRGGDANAFSALMAEDYPSTNAFLGCYVELGGAVAWDESKSRLRFAPSARMRREALTADYPRFARFVIRSSEVLRASGKVADDAGARVATWAFRGPEEGIGIETVFRDARLLPLAGDGEGRALDRPFDVAFDSDVSITALGLRTSIEGARTTLALDPPAARLSTTAAGMPRRTGIDGALFGILTPGALDLMVPGSIDGILQDLLRSVLEGRDKRGFEAWVRADERDEPGFQLRSDAAVDVSSARLVRVALAIGARWLYPTDEEAEDMRRFVLDVVARLRGDAERARSNEVRRKN